MKIDFVIAWVDGNDPEWLQEKAKYDPSIDLTQDTIDARYREWDNLQYWFRAVEKFAPWVNKIHFLTWGHIPKWLDVNNPKLHIVNHKDYIPSEFLPTFNSHTIELNIHRIEGLSEHFVYFNDDVFLTSPVKETDFFKNNLPCDYFALDCIYFAPDSAGAYNGNNMEIINKHFVKSNQFKLYKFKKYIKLRYGIKNLYRTIVLMKWPWFPGFRYDHLANCFLKSTLTTVWDAEEEILRATCMDKFRSKRNVNQWIFKYWQLASGNFHPRPSLGKAFHLKITPNLRLKEAIEMQSYKIICINDTARTQNFEAHRDMVKESFQKILPNKCSFEIQ
ncbi:MAG: Stealth CR1 domain-containing protein [Lachnospiraceae bacterium]|nr:Stealth CR1 domain-containing protein [Lachnospiraceae bacterium]